MSAHSDNVLCFVTLGALFCYTCMTALEFPLWVAEQNEVALAIKTKGRSKPCAEEHTFPMAQQTLSLVRRLKEKRNNLQQSSRQNFSPLSRAEYVSALCVTAQHH